MLLKNLIEIINNQSIYKYRFVNDKFINEIKLIVKNMFPNLNSNDSKILIVLTSFLIEKISTNNFFKRKEKYYLQWKQNGGRDIKSTLLMLLPFIDDKESKSLYTKITKLQQLLWNDNSNQISNDYLDYSRNDLLRTKFNFGNFALGLFNNSDKDNLLDLKVGDEDLIHTIIHHNFIALLESFKISNGKLYVNWINVQPVSLDIYKQKPFYQETKSKIKDYYEIISRLNIQKSVNVNNDMLSFDLNYNGLFLGDFYNVFRMKYYQEIKKIKWVIFNNENNTDGNKYMIQYLHNMLNLNSVLNNDNFLNLKEDEKLEFSKNLKKIITNLKNKTNIIDNHEFEKNLMETLLIFFSNNYSYRNLIKSNKIKKFITKDDQDDDIKDKEINRYYNKFELDDVIQALNEIDIEQLWEYLKETVNHLQNTIYGEYLIKKKNDKLKFTKFYTFKGKKLNLKNIYNISKTLSHFKFTIPNEGTESYLLLQPIYQALELEAVKRFWLSLYDNTTLLNTIQLKSNLNKQSGRSLSNSEYRNKIAEIVNDFLSEDEDGNKFWFTLVWECLIKNGLISEFYVNLDVTDTINHPSNFNQKKKYIWNKLKSKINKNRSNYDNSYYYLTNCKYKRMKKIKINNQELDYLDVITNEDADQAWYTFYAMDWISQINFFKRYINHQIIYVTGSTGTGKSTQVPKLLMYALKMYDYKNNGRICCTQPRIPPTVENTERISKELGIPIEHKKEKTNNYYLQFKHQYDRHTKDKTPHLQLRMVTDGTLLQEVITNPIMKEEYPTNKIIDGKAETEYGKNNKWDILIVDEAHEHNTNMDLILTLGRNTCFYNNSVRLVIISATMDDDEPIYRSYFKLINDNFLYPLKRPLLSHSFSIDFKNFIIYSILMDRRFHISPPGGTTLHKITDIYLDNIQYTGDDRKDSQIAQKESYKIVEQICKKSQNGQILLFSTGQREILDAVEYLNQVLPPGDIALPYFTSLHPNYKSMMSKIDKNVFKIRNFRKNIHKEWGMDYIEDKKVPKGLYKRAIIIATNVAEASITISGLKYVIDNGYAKVNKFDEIKNKTNLLIEKISEASRIQRRGRVGRIASGTVYYLYKKGARENIKPKYKITQDDFHENFLQLLSESSNREVIPAFYNQYTYKVDEGKILINKALEHQIYQLKMNHFSKEQDKVETKNIKIDDSYYQSPFFDYLFKNSDKINQIFMRDSTGFDFHTLLDLSGIFYLINPKEELLERNIDNGIYLIKNSNKKKIDDKYFTNFIKNMEFKLYLFNFHPKNIRLVDKTYVKSKIHAKISELKRDTILEENELFSLIIGSGYNITEEIIEILSMLRSINGNVMSLAIKDKKFPDYKNFYSMYKNDKSDLLAIYKIIQLFKFEFKDMKIFKLRNNNKDFLNKLKKDYQNLINEYYLSKNNLDIDTRNIFNYLINNGKIKSDSGFLYWLSLNKNKINEFTDDIKKNKNKIIKWCKNNYINYDTLILFLENYLEMIIKIVTSKKDYDEKLEELNSLEWIKTISSGFYRSLKTGTIEEKIVNTFLIAYSENIAIKINSNDKNYHMVKGYKANPAKLYFGSKIDNTLCKDMNSYIFYLNSGEMNDQNTFTINTKVDPETLVRNLPIIYNVINFKNYYLIDKYLITFFGKNYDYFLDIIRNNWSTIYFLWDSKELPNIRNYLKLVKKDIIMKS